MKIKKIVALTGAGISAESGVKTFRDSGGLWEGHHVMEVASPEGFKNNPELVLDFYNQRRKQLFDVKPNEAHKALKKLEEKFDVKIITQNVDDLHERAGSKHVLHLHGELRKVKPINNEKNIIDWTGDLNIGDTDKNGIQLRPHVVWFGEMVPNIEPAIEIVKTADYLLIIGTSLQVYPAAGLIEYAKPTTPITIIDPNSIDYHSSKNIHHIQQVASMGMIEYVNWILKE